MRNSAVTTTDERATFGDDSAEHDNITVVPSILPPRATFGDAAARPCVQYDEAGIDLHANLVDYTELETAKAHFVI